MQGFMRDISDKGGLGGCHDYSFVYETVFKSLIWPFKILEIGCTRYVIHGSKRLSMDDFVALPMVSSYIGVDIDPMQRSIQSEKFGFIQGDAYSKDVVSMCAEKSPYDLIIDDASHYPEDQLYFFQKYAKLLAPHGFLVCEDIHKDNAFRLFAQVLEQGLDAVLIGVPPNGDFCAILARV